MLEKKTECPWCAYHIDRHSSMNDNETDLVPVKGDITICIKCGEFMIYDVKLELIPASKMDFDTLDLGDKSKLLFVQNEIKTRLKLKQWM